MILRSLLVEWLWSCLGSCWWLTMASVIAIVLSPTTSMYGTVVYLRSPAVLNKIFTIGTDLLDIYP